MLVAKGQGRLVHFLRGQVGGIVVVLEQPVRQDWLGRATLDRDERLPGQRHALQIAAPDAFKRLLQIRARMLGAVHSETPNQRLREEAGGRGLGGLGGLEVEFIGAGCAVDWRWRWGDAVLEMGDKGWEKGLESV